MVCACPLYGFLLSFMVIGYRFGGGRCDKSKTIFMNTLRLYSRVVGCEIRKIEVFYIDFSRPSPESKSGRGIH